MHIGEIMEKNLKTMETMQQSSTNKYKCPTCGHMIYDAELLIPTPKGSKKILVNGIGCWCWQTEEMQRILKEQGISHSLDMYERSGIGMRFKQCTFDKFRVFPEVADAFEIVADYAENFNEYRETGTGLILKGKPGCGKTHLAAAIAQELIFKGTIVKFMLTPVLLEEIRKSYNKKYFEGETNILSQLSSVQLLILDDLGAEKPTEWVTEQLFILINKRYEEMKPTIITTNCTGQDLAARIGERTASRLVEVSKIVNIKAGDYRIKKAV